MFASNVQHLPRNVVIMRLVIESKVFILLVGCIELWQGGFSVSTSAVANVYHLKLLDKVRASE